jgi:site-specific recombinase XerD
MSSLNAISPAIPSTGTATRSACSSRSLQGCQKVCRSSRCGRSLGADLVRRFLTNLESSRSCKIATRNQRLAAIRGFAGFVAARSPVHIEWCGQIRSIPFKQAGTAVMPYLEKAEIDALLAAPDRQTAQGRRVYALLLFLYNAGARATEAAQLKVRDLDIRASCVRLQERAESSAFAGYGAALQPNRPKGSSIPKTYRKTSTTSP